MSFSRNALKTTYLIIKINEYCGVIEVHERSSTVVSTVTTWSTIGAQGDVYFALSECSIMGYIILV